MPPPQDPPPRPAVDVVVPFLGSGEERAALLARLGALRLRPGDRVVVADNGPEAPPADPRVVHAPGVPSSYHARNRGAADGTGAWLVFLDADVLPPDGLLDAYFAAPVADEVGVLAGGVVDQEPEELTDVTPATRYAALTAPMSQANTLRGGGRWSYAQTANCAVRRSAFEAVGGFDEQVRSGGDADLCFRLHDAGWALQSCPAAVVVHRNRSTLRSLVLQRARHGAGAAWLERRYPGAFPAANPLGAAKWSAGELARAARGRATGDRDDALVRSVGVLSHWAFELGRLRTNRPRERARA